MKALTKEQQKKKEMIEFLKHILPYWDSEDLDDYMYIVHHYDLERVATKIQDRISQQKQAFQSTVLEILTDEIAITHTRGKTSGLTNAYMRIEKI